jgi:hypothetical protein
VRFEEFSFEPNFLAIILSRFEKNIEYKTTGAFDLHMFPNVFKLCNINGFGLTTLFTSNGASIRSAREHDLRSFHVLTNV